MSNQKNTEYATDCESIRKLQNTSELLQECRNPDSKRARRRWWQTMARIHRAYGDATMANVTLAHINRLFGKD